MNTPTPRTDAVVWRADLADGSDVAVVDAEFARTLERELNEALDTNKRANEAIGNQANENDKIYKQLRSDLKMCAEALECANRLYILEHTIARSSLVSEFLPKLQKALNNPRIQAILNEKESDK